MQYSGIVVQKIRTSEELRDREYLQADGVFQYLIEANSIDEAHNKMLCAFYEKLWYNNSIDDMRKDVFSALTLEKKQFALENMGCYIDTMVWFNPDNIKIKSIWQKI
jgi:hypothetical protein